MELPMPEPSQSILLVCYISNTAIKSIMKFVENTSEDFVSQI